jgi:SAM-dependent methyltransferase
MTNPTLRQFQPDELYNGFIGANVAFAFHQIGLFSILTPGRSASAKELAEKTGTDERRLKALLQVGVALGNLVQDGQGNYGVTPAGEELRRWLGYFTWSVGGYGKLLRQLGPLAKNETSWDGMRDSGMVAIGTDYNSRMLMQEPFWDVLDKLQFSVIADLGCGNAGRLVQCCQRYPRVKGVGIDISRSAISLAEELVRKEGVADRMTLVCGDVLEAIGSEQHRDVLSQVEIVTSFMMLHDLLNVSGLKDSVFDRLRRAFPHAKYFLIADTPRMPPLEELSKVPIFNLGYDLLHEFMSVRLPARAEYEEAYAKAGLTVERCLDFGSPFTYLWLLRT